MICMKNEAELKKKRKLFCFLFVKGKPKLFLFFKKEVKFNYSLETMEEMEWNEM